MSFGPKWNSSFKCRRSKSHKIPLKPIKQPSGEKGENISFTSVIGKIIKSSHYSYFDNKENSGKHRSY